MHRINLETWPRRKHFNVFSQWDYPHFSMCANMDLTVLMPYLRQQGTSITIAMVYLVARAANAVPEFRWRIRPGEVVAHDIVHPAVTILGKDDLFGFCHFRYEEDFSDFAADAAGRIAAVKESPSIENPSGRDDYLYMTSIPWVSFTSFLHPLHLHPVDSVPRFAWGRFFEEGDLIKMPLNAQGHHAVMDGLHMGRFYNLVEEYLKRPEEVLASSPVRRESHS